MSTSNISESEAERYDRQIRVWGAEAQYRLQNSKVFIGGLGGLNTEVVKNIILAGNHLSNLQLACISDRFVLDIHFEGVNICIQDSSTVKGEHFSSCFFLPDETVIGHQFAEAAKDQICELNKYANVGIETRPLEEIEDAFFNDFAVIVLDDSSCNESQALRINRICRASSPETVFFWGGIFGMEAWLISDFGPQFQYQNDPPHNKELKLCKFPSLDTVLSTKLSSALVHRHLTLSPTYVKGRLIAKFKNEMGGRAPSATDEIKMKSLAEELFREHGLSAEYLTEDQLAQLCRVASFSVVGAASILGSILAQEVIKAISKAGVPGCNVFTFSGEDLVVKAIAIGAD